MTAPKPFGPCVVQQNGWGHDVDTVILRRKRPKTAHPYCRYLPEASWKLAESTITKNGYDIYVLSVVCASFLVEQWIQVKRVSCHFWEFILKRSFNERDWYEISEWEKLLWLFVLKTATINREKEHSSTGCHFCGGACGSLSLVIGLYSAAYMRVAHLFCILRKSVCLIICCVCKAIVKVLTPKYIGLSKTENQITDIVEGLRESWGFPNYAAAYNGSHALYPHFCTI